MLLQKARIQLRVAGLIDEGWNTRQIADDWNVDLAVLNKIYTS
jgi:hypothetical protein